MNTTNVISDISNDTPRTKRHALAFDGVCTRHSGHHLWRISSLILSGNVCQWPLILAVDMVEFSCRIDMAGGFEPRHGGRLLS